MLFIRHSHTKQKLKHIKGLDYTQLVGIPSLFHFLLPNIAIPLFMYYSLSFLFVKLNPHQSSVHKNNSKYLVEIT